VSGPTDRIKFQERKKKKERKKENYASSKKLLMSIKERGPFGKKSPFTKEKGGSVARAHLLRRKET